MNYIGIWFVFCCVKITIGGRRWNFNEILWSLTNVYGKLKKKTTSMKFRKKMSDDFVLDKNEKQHDIDIEILILFNPNNQ